MDIMGQSPYNDASLIRYNYERHHGTPFMTFCPAGNI